MSCSSIKLLVLSGVLIVASAWARPPATAPKSNDSTPPPATELSIAPTMKFSVYLGAVTMTQATANDEEEGLQFLKMMMAAQGQDTSALHSSGSQTTCAECAGVKQSIVQVLGDGGMFKIRDQEAGCHFQIQAAILNKAESATTTTGNTNNARGRLNNLPGGIGGLLGGSEVSSTKKEVRMDVAVSITNAVTHETRSHQFAGSAKAKDLGLDVEGFFQVAKDSDPSIAIACADAAKQAATWLTQTAAQISTGLEFWADVVRVTKNVADKDSLVMLNLGKVDGVVPGLVFAVGDTFSVRPGIWEIEEVGRVETLTVEDYYCWAAVRTSTKPIKPKVMTAKLRQ